MSGKAALLLAACLAVAAPAAQAEAREVFGDRWQEFQSSVAELQALAERAIVLGGAVLYRHRHTVAGAVIGCAAGAAAGAGSAVAAGAATGGAALAVTPQATALGCSLGAAGGAALGYPYDHIFDE